MKNIVDLAELLHDYGPRFYGVETPEYVASQWARALPKADLSDFHEWFDRGFCNPDVAGALWDAGVFPWEVPASTVYDLCNGVLSVALFLKSRRQ